MQDFPDIDDIVSLVDDGIMDDDELDLINLVSSNANDSNQYLFFLSVDNQYYAMNVSKIEELLAFRDLEIAYNHDNNSVIEGTANIRGDILSIVNFDKWMGNEITEEVRYKIAIVAAYGGKRFAMLVKDVDSITSIDANNMTDNSCDNSKSSFVSTININNTERLCTIFDSDMLILDIFDDIEQNNEIEFDLEFTLNKSNKLVLFADDSKYIRAMVEKLFKQLNLNYKIYKDGKELIDDLPNHQSNLIGLFVTDLEMPRANGRDVIKYIRDEDEYKDINIIVHTNMSNDIITQDLLQSKVEKIINKVDMVALAKAIVELII